MTNEPHGGSVTVWTGHGRNSGFGLFVLSSLNALFTHGGYIPLHIE